MNDQGTKCFACDEIIQGQKINLFEGTSYSKSSFTKQISQLLGDDFIVIVQQEDYLCKHCVFLFSTMDSLENELAVVKKTLLEYLKKKYGLHYSEKHNKMISSVGNDDEGVNETFKDLKGLHPEGLEPLKCVGCSFTTEDISVYEFHMWKHVKMAMESEFGKNDPDFSTVKLFKCDVCSKLYLTHSKCVEHMKSHLLDNAVVKKSELLNSVNNEKNFKCGKCSIVFNSVEKVQSHACSVEIYNSHHDIPVSSKERAFNNNFPANRNKINNLFSIEVEKIAISSVKEPSLAKSEIKSCSMVVDEDSDDESEVVTDSESDLSSDMCDDFDVELGKFDRTIEDGIVKYICENCGFKSDYKNMKEHYFEERPQRDLICSVCGQSFNSFCKLMKHSSGHDINAKPVRCFYCLKILPDLLCVHYHMKKMHLELVKEITCTNCQQVFPNSAFLENHICTCELTNTLSQELSQELRSNINCITESDFEIGKIPDITEDIKIVYKCGFCSEIRITEEELVEHFKSHSNINICDICQIDPFIDLTKHKLGHSLVNQEVICEYCSKILYDHLHLKYHIIYSHPGFLSKLFCSICNLSFKTVRIFKKHLLLHKYPSFRCSKCDTNFYTKFKLAKHYLNKHKQDLRCSLCDKLCTSVKTLHLHKCVNKKLCLKCDHCNRSFKMWSSLVFHKLKHSSELNYICKSCELSFLDEKTFILHNRECHTLVPLICSICGKDFLSFSSYKVHRLKHEHTLPYCCNICNQRFTKISVLCVHKKGLHGKQKLLKCNNCLFVTKTLSIYRKHMYQHVREFPYHCKRCLRKYSKLEDYKKHIHRIHKPKVHSIEEECK